MDKKSKIALIVIFILFGLYTVYLSVFIPVEKRGIPAYIPMILMTLIFAFIHGYSMFLRSYNKDVTFLKKEIRTKDQLSKSIRKHNEACLSSLPIGIVIYSDDLIITYANDEASKIFRINNLVGKHINDLSNVLNNNVLSNSSFEDDVFNKHYLFQINNDSNCIYIFDKTDSFNSLNQYNITRPSLLVLSIDNIEVLENYDLQEKTKILSKYYKAIETWRDKFNLFQVSNDEDKMIFLFDALTLKEIKKDGFSLLKEVDSISSLTKIDISLSIGVGTNTDSYNELGIYAYKALDYALSRGGNQAIIFDKETYLIYQGEGSPKEIRSRIQSRIYSEKLVELIKNSSSVIITPHIDTDADAFASSYALYLLSKELGTPSKILLDPDRIDSTVRKIISQSSNEYIVLKEAIIKEKDVNEYTDGKPLLILVDHHDKKLSTSDRVYDLINNITVIDHHRLTEPLEYNPVIENIDHSASSTVELISEILDILSLDMDIPSFVSTMMYVGMIIDTNDFKQHVSENTFKVAAFLMSNGADVLKAKMYLREPIVELEKRTNILKSSEIISGHYGLVKLDNEKIVQKEDLAKAAEALLDTEGINAAFAFGRLSKNQIGISARSNGNFNVHSEMEKIGGGGHFNMAAAQVDNISLDDVYEEVLINLKATIDGGITKMKIILIEDVKGKGKKGDIVEVNPGYANFLMSKKYAVEANDDNLAALSIAKQNKAKQDQEELDVANKLKTLIESIKVTIKVKLGDNGKFFGSIQSKTIADELLKEHKIDIDKRKINLTSKIDSVGTYECSIKLHKEVTATLKFDVCE